MTEDTKRALEVIKPLCEFLNISTGADKSLLYMNGQAIGIGCNSTYATVMEALGYIFLKEYPKFRHGAVVDGETQEDIKRYWISKPALNKPRRAGVIDDN